MSKKRVLFVCLGNICRSPAAEAIFQNLVLKSKLEDQFECESAGTGDWHVGEKADPRMRKYCEERGYQLTTLARHFNPDTDFDRFDLIVTMDDSNFQNVQNLNKGDPSQVRKMCDFLMTRPEKFVPDPYHGGREGFEEVIDILEESCRGLLRFLEDEFNS